MACFVNKVVIVTGASAGIGAATAVRFAQEGANVAIVGRNQERLAKVAEDCAKYGRNPLVIKADVSKDDEARSIVAKTVEAFDKLDILVNNAGIYKYDDIQKPDFMEIFDSIMTTNMRAVAFLTNLAVPYLIESKGNIVNVSSIAGRCVGHPHRTSYKTSKAALNHFTRCIALELAPHGVRVNSVSPGPVATEIFNTAGLPDALTTLKDATALGRVGESEEIADLILFVASDKAKSITGSDYVSDNGMLLKQ
ncbi:glucose 1-dehydrogenase-like [Manduca sexta]|uniref:glucose 1-dehydrogenase-like n=1 Tax=Manduca sexta TaxID=7130 RepID=UPI0011836A20|nr:glucose 1-dehydrogenase-like [Manduca sexta]